VLSSSRWRRFVLFLVTGDFFGSSSVPSTFKVGSQPGPDHFLDLFFADEIGRQAHHIGIVVPAA
jgi:hypothetical protein